MEKVVVGMSGGVDSFVTALMLQRQGYEVIGVTLELWKKNNSEELQMLCKQLNIELITWDGRDLFLRQVVSPFGEGYASGQTPSPCCVCNRFVKWTLLAQAADSLGIKKIATGHYVRILETADGYYIRKGVDSNKDQSYFLWGVPQEMLARALTPLGGLTKAEVKAYAAAYGFERMAVKPESMGICFLEGRDYRDFITHGSNDVRTPGLAGNILDTDGNVIGCHSGILNYTIGQKRGLPLRDGRPLYVTDICPETNTITVDVKEGLCRMSLDVEQVEAVTWDDLFGERVEIKIRGLGWNPAGYISVTEKSGNCLNVQLASPAWAVAPGQPVAFYRDDLLLGGGIVKK